MTGGNRNQESWEDVYLFDVQPHNSENERKYLLAVERNGRIYDQIPREAYETIEDCVNYAIENGHHGAFVHYYLERSCRGDDLFHKRFMEYVGARFGSTPGQCAELKNCILMKNPFWRSVDFSLAHVEQDESAFFYSRENIGNWIRDRKDPYWKKPPREALIQCGFYLRLNGDQVNELLHLAGYENLYPFDPVDALCLYRFNHQETCQDTYRRLMPDTAKKQKSFLGRVLSQELSQVKQEINDLLSQDSIWSRMMPLTHKTKLDVTDRTRLSSEELLALECMNVQYMEERGRVLIQDIPDADEKRLRQLHLYWDDQKKRLKRYYYVREQVFPGKLVECRDGKWSIITEIEELARQLGYSGQKEDGSLASYPTQYLNRIMETENPSKYLESYGTFKRYGYLYRTLQFLQNRRYEKNLYYSNYPLNCSTRISIEQPKDSETELSFCYYCPESHQVYSRNWISREAERHRREKASDTEDRNLIYQIWILKNCLDERADVSAKKLPPLSVLNNLLYGRSQAAQRQDGAEDLCTESLNGQQVGYTYDIGNKTRSIQMALATGNEEVLGEYLYLAGFWERDLYHDYVAAQGEQIERVDSFVIYLLKYRDKLIDYWVKQFGKQHQNEDILDIVREKLREEFPLIRLAMTINRDILFVCRELAPSQDYEKREDYYELLNSMVYPIKTSQKRWYEAYAQAMYFDEETGKITKTKLKHGKA